MKIDAHQHFWQYNTTDYAWIGPELATLRRDFLPPHLQIELASSGFVGSVAIQARQSLQETDWLLHLADRWDLIKGVVGWFDLQAPDVHGQLAAYAQHPKLVGVRHVVQDEPDDDFMLRSDFRRGLELLQQFQLTYDLLLYPRHLPVACKLVAALPQQRFVLDHIAKPDIKHGLIAPWERDLQALAKFPHVYCKLSGMVTEADWHSWQPADFRPYLDIVLAAFGPHRVMIGSDWPVCTVSNSYNTVMKIVTDYIATLTEEEQAAILGENAARFYGLD